MSKEIIKYALAVAGVILGWVMVVPAFESPDEQAHLGSISYLISNNQMPVYDKLELTQEMAETQKILGIFRDGLGNNLYTYHPEHHVEYAAGEIGIYEDEIKSLNSAEFRDSYVGKESAKYPILYYAFASLYTRAVNGYDLLTRLYVTRLSGLDIAAVMAVVVWQIGMIVYGKKSYAMLLTLMVMLQPMFSFVTSGVNSDNLHNLLFFLVIYLGLKLIKYELAYKDLFFMALVIALDIYTKPQGFIALPVAGIALLLAVIKSRKWKMLYALFAIGAVAILLGSSQWEKYIHLLSSPNRFDTTFIDYLRFSANKLVAQNAVWYWGVFKWLGVVLPPIYWRIANRVVLLSVVGLGVYLWKVIKKKKVVAPPYTTIFLFLVSLIYALAIFWYDWQHTKLNGYSLGIQGRYFFPTLVAHMAIMLTGIVSLAWNIKTRIWLKRGLVVLFVSLQLGAIYHVVSIYYPAQNLGELISQISQYKPSTFKGNWIYLWAIVYLYSVFYLAKNALSQGKVAAAKPRQT